MIYLNLPKIYKNMAKKISKRNILVSKSSILLKIIGHMHIRTYFEVGFNKDLSETQRNQFLYMTLPNDINITKNFVKIYWLKQKELSYNPQLLRTLSY